MTDAPFTETHRLRAMAKALRQWEGYLPVENGFAMALDGAADEIDRLTAALGALYTAARGDEEGQWWPIREWMDQHGIFNDDIQSYQRLSEIVLKHLLKPETP